MSWSEEEINQMEAKFQEFLDQKHNGSLRWDLGKRTIKFDDELREEEYWMMRFDDEYMKIRNNERGSNEIRVANIHIYIYYVTDKKMIGSSKYPEEMDFFCFFEQANIYYPKYHLTVRISDDKKYKNYAPEKIKRMNKRFETFICKFNDGSLNWDFSLSRWYPVLYSDDECGNDEFEYYPDDDYWPLGFKEEYNKVKEGKDDKDCELVAAMHVYIYYCTNELLLRSENFPDDLGCLKHLEEKIVYYNLHAYSRKWEK